MKTEKKGWDDGTDIHTLLWIKQVTGENLLCSAGDLGGGRSKKEGVYVYIRPTHSAGQQETNITL